LKRIFVLLDARHGLKRIDMEYLAELNGNTRCKFQIVLNKCDEVSIEELAKRGTLVSRRLQHFSSALQQPIFTSARMTKGLDSFRNILFHLGSRTHKEKVEDVKVGDGEGMEVTEAGGI